MGYYQIIPLCSGVWGILTDKIQRGVKWVTWSKLRLHCVMRSVKNKCQPFVFVQLSSQNTKQIWKYLSTQSHIWNTFFQRQIELGQHSSFITFDIFPSWREVWKNYNNVFFVPGGRLGLPPGLPGGHLGRGLQHQLLRCPRSVNTYNIDDDVLFSYSQANLRTWGWPSGQTTPRPRPRSPVVRAPPRGRCLMCRTLIRTCTALPRGHSTGLTPSGKATPTPRSPSTVPDNTRWASGKTWLFRESSH